MADLPARRVLRALQRAGALRRVAKDAGLELDELLKLA